MTGPGYDLKDVPWVMYFYKGYSFHGTYWHTTFGQPMSHGCVNMITEDAKWLFDWAPKGTKVEIGLKNKNPLMAGFFIVKMNPLDKHNR